MLSILAKGAAGNISAIVTGNIVKNDNLELCIRATNSLNFRDISDQEFSLTKLGAGLLVDTNGIKANGANGLLVSSFDETNYNDFSMGGVINVTTNTGSAEAVKNWMGGSYLDNTKGMGLFIVTELVSGEQRQTFRAVFYGRRTTTGEPRFVFVNRVLGVVGAANVAVPIHYIMMTQQTLGNGDTLHKLHVPSLGIAPVLVTTLGTSNISFTAANRVLNWDVARDFRIGTVKNTGLNSTVHTENIKEFMFYGVPLTDQEVLDQYQATKKWLLAEGVVNISHWV